MALGNSNSPVCNHSPNLAQQSSDSTLNVFEGPEKKLEMHFKRSTVGKRLHTCQTADRCNSLRNLRRCDIEAILRAAACNILSVAKNEHTDAYLLSESSLFVSDTCLTLKTCGTTRLLLALPVILKLVSDKLALLVTYVQFSRVSYILPDAQLFPHDSIANEVSFLDRALNTKGRVFQAPLFSSSWWYMYSTTLAPCAGRGGKLKNTESQDEKNCETLDQKQALELYMFDLDPSAMKQFMFGDRPRMWGRDTIADGTTSLVGIDKLLLDGATIDAFNFKPCGYSMNAMHDRSYYTIHVSPEPDASYVSFETTASHRNISKLITSVVKLFKPSRFTVAIIPNPTNGCSMSGREEHQLSMMNKHMLTQSFCAAASNVFSVDERSHAIVSSFLSVENWTRPISPSSIFDELSEHEDVVKRLNTVGRAHNAHFIEDYESSAFAGPGGVDLEELRYPRFVVDLSRIVKNIQYMRTLANSKRVQLRYPVRCNPDKAVLAILSSQEIWYEVASTAEIELLQSLDIPRYRIVLALPVLTPSALSMFDIVGVVILFREPSEDVLKSLKRSQVGVEIRVGAHYLSDLESIVSSVLGVTRSICAVGVDSEPVKTSSSEILDRISTWVGEVEESLEAVPNSVKETIAVDIGESLWHNMDLRNMVARETIHERLRRLLSRIPLVTVDVGRLLVGNSASLITHVIGRRCRPMEDAGTNGGNCEMAYSYYLDDGVYGAFSRVIMEPEGYGKEWRLEPYALVNNSGDTDKSVQPVHKDEADGSGKKTKQRLHTSTLFGPTCDAIDRIWVGKLPILDVGDRVVFPDMGAYTWCMGSTFNGFGRRFDTTYVVSRCV